MSAKSIGSGIAVIFLLWGFNHATAWAFGYPVVYCVAPALVPAFVKELASVALVFLAIGIIIALISRSKGIGGIIGIMFAIGALPVFFETLFNTGVACG